MVDVPRRNPRSLKATIAFWKGVRTHALTYDAALRTYTFDVNGNMVSANAGGAVTKLTYDRENRTIQHQGAGARVDFEYDPFFHKKSEQVGRNDREELYWLGASC